MSLVRATTTTSLEDVSDSKTERKSESQAKIMAGLSPNIIKHIKKLRVSLHKLQTKPQPKIEKKDEKKETFNTREQLSDLMVAKIRKTTIKDFIAGKLDGYIGERIQHYCKMENRVGLKLLSYALFAGIFLRRPLTHKKYIEPINKALQRSGVDTIAKEILTAYSFIKIDCREQMSQLDKLTEYPFGHINLALEKADMFNEMFAQIKKSNPERFTKAVCMYEEESEKEKSRAFSESDRLITITHAGGARSIMDLLAGISSGYPLEGYAGCGIQVHPHEHYTKKYWSRERELHSYAPKAFGHFDRPCILTAKIPEKCLLAAPNGYEAGLSYKNVSDLTDVTIEFPNVRPSR